MKICLACTARFAGASWRCPHCGHQPPHDGNSLVLTGAEPASQAGYDDRHFPALARAEERHFWFVNRRKLVLALLQRYFRGSQTFLEVGCGTGFLAAQVARTFPEWQVSGSDYSATGIGQAAQRANRVEWLRMDALKIPFEDEFDLICALDVIEHIDDDRTVLKQFHNATRPGGGLILTVPQHAWLWSPFDKASGHKRRYRRDDLAGKVTAAGFTVRAISSFNSLLLPALILRRRHSGEQAVEDIVEQELRLPHPWVNALGSVAGRLEHAFIRRGGSFPAGGSLLLVATR